MFDLNTSILDEYGEELDDERLEEYIDAVMDEFADSPEGIAWCEQHDRSLGYADLYMNYLAQYHVATPADASVWASEEVVFELFPRKVSVEADEADAIIQELRAFWRFLKRTRGLPQADEILERLGEGAVERLKAELADSTKHGMAKSFFRAGKSAGFDMTTQEGLNQFVAVYNAGLLQAQDAAEDQDDDVGGEFSPFSIAPFRSETPKVGRNDPCPCGSGRKYKKCCGGQ